MSSSPIPTPDLSHLSETDYDQVYEPAEDSFLLLDALEKDLKELKLKKPLFAVEIGCGSGIISTAIQLKLPETFFFVTDINRHACTATQATAVKNNTSLEVGCKHEMNYSPLHSTPFLLSTQRVCLLLVLRTP